MRRFIVMGCAIATVAIACSTTSRGSGPGGSSDAGSSATVKKDSGYTGTCTVLRNVSFDDPSHSTCDACMGQKCCSEVTSCYGDSTSACTALSTCLVECDGDKSCQEQCGSNSTSSAISQINAVLDCLVTQCTECP